MSKKKYLLTVAGVIGMIVGITMAIPGIFKEDYLVALLSIFLLVGGVILLAISFDDEDEYTQKLRSYQEKYT